MSLPNDSLNLLIEGNKRYTSGVRSVDSLLSTLKLKSLAQNGQKPFAVIVTCSDSRAPTETIFDRGLGDLFVVRVAGNTISPSFIGGIEYAINFFQVPLCLVLGHTDCGAIRASMAYFKNPQNPLPSPSLEFLVKNIIPANFNGDDLTWANVQNNVRRIETESQLIANKVSEEKFRVVGAVYNIENGIVKFDLPNEELVKIAS